MFEKRGGDCRIKSLALKSDKKSGKLVDQTKKQLALAGHASSVPEADLLNMCPIWLSERIERIFIGFLTSVIDIGHREPTGDGSHCTIIIDGD